MNTKETESTNRWSPLKIIGLFVATLLFAVAVNIFVVYELPNRSGENAAEETAAARMELLDADAREANEFIAGRLTEMINKARYKRESYWKRSVRWLFGVNKHELKLAEAGEYPLSHAELSRICAYFNVSLADFLDERIPVGQDQSVVNFTKARLKIQMTRGEFAAKAGLESSEAVSAIETGERLLIAAEWTGMYKALAPPK